MKKENEFEPNTKYAEKYDKSLFVFERTLVNQIKEWFNDKGFNSIRFDNKDKPLRYFELKPTGTLVFPSLMYESELDGNRLTFSFSYYPEKEPVDCDYVAIEDMDLIWLMSLCDFLFHDIEIDGR